MKRFISILLTAVMIFALMPFGSISVSAAEIYTDSQGVTYTLCDDGAYYIVSDFDDSVTEVVIPPSIKGIPVTSIGERAFFICFSLTSITIPDSVTSIGDEAFSYCKSLTRVTIPDGVTSIGGETFYNCSRLTSITIPDSVTYIGYGAFYWCTSLESIDIPDNVTTIGNAAFNSCYSLTSITIPDSVTSIGDETFYNCQCLTSITIPNSVTSIGDCAFYCCYSLTSITIPDSVTNIGEYAFFYCDSLTSIVIPDSVTSIGDSAFSRCENLTDIYCEAEAQPEGWDEYWLSDCTATVHWGYIEQTEKEALDSAILDAETLIEDAFSTEQWANIQTALSFAKAYDATDKSDEDIQSVTEALAEIVAGAPLVKGDADRSGEVDQFDYLLVKRAYFDTYNLYTGDLLRADIDGDGEINQFDYLCIKRAYFGTYTIA